MFGVKVSELWDALELARSEYVIGLSNRDEYFEALVAVARDIISFYETEVLPNKYQ